MSKDEGRRRNAKRSEHWQHRRSGSRAIGSRGGRETTGTTTAAGTGAARRATDDAARDGGSG